jgi:hypothetical protein
MGKTATLLRLVLGAALAAPARGACVQVPRDAESPPVRACETETAYELEITGERFVYDKADYQEGLRAALRQWLRSAGLDDDGGDVEVWLSVPEAAPAATGARVVVRTTSGHAFVAFTSLHPEDWRLTDASIGVLASGQSYPSSFGARPRQLLVRSAPGAARGAVEELMTRHGAGSPTVLSGEWTRWLAPPFREADVLSAASSDADAPVLLRSVTLNLVVEWIALREKAFAFSLASP